MGERFEYEKIAGEIPDGLLDMPMDMQEKYYPYEQRPEIVISDEDGKIHMTIELIEKKMLPEETGKAANAVRKFAMILYPQNEILPVHLYLGEDISVGWFVIKLENNKDKLRHIKATLPSDNKMCLITLTYPEQEHLKWEVNWKKFLATLHKL
ncbi:MAG: hypothetical protein ACRDBO_19785 [Lachnospiraceae bacterium]